MPWLWYCKGTELASWKVYEDMKSMSATDTNLKFYVNVLFTPFDGLPLTSYNTKDVLTNIASSSSDNECLKSEILNDFCSIVYLKTAESWISKIPYMKPKISQIASVTTKTALWAVLKTIPSIPESIFKAYAAIVGLPIIAESLYTASLSC
jgi:hypothetical protein